MSAEVELCNFCRQPANLSHDLLWDLGDSGTWCGECGLGMEVVSRMSNIALIIQRRDELMDKLPLSRVSVDKLDKMLNNRFDHGFRA